jgi:hypothetical protein
MQLIDKIVVKTMKNDSPMLWKVFGSEREERLVIDNASSCAKHK